MRRLLHRATTGLHRDDGGQSIAFVALTGFLICCFVILMLNNGRHLTHKVIAQNAVDSAAVSAATHQARGMNLIAMTNIMQSMLLAEAMFVAAMPMAVAQSAAMAAANAACYCDPWCEFDAGKCVQSIWEEIQSWIVGIQLIFEIWDFEEFLFDRMEQLSEVAASIQEGFQFTAMQEANTMARLNGLDYGFAWPNTMPLEEGGYTDLCDTMYNGNGGGYEKWWNEAFIIAMLYFSITEYPEMAFAPAYAAYPHFAGGPFGSPTQALPFEMLFGEMAPLALGNTWWELWSSAVYIAECWGGLPYLSLYTDTDRSVPLLLDGDYPDSGQYVAIGYDPPEQGAPTYMPDYFENPYNEMFGMITVAQAEVVNTYDASMFVPRWHARLVPVSKVGDMPTVITGYMFSTPGLPPPFGPEALHISAWTLTMSDLTQEVITH